MSEWLPASPVARCTTAHGISLMEAARSAASPALLFFEHPHTLTLGPRTPPEDLFFSHQELAQRGYEVLRVPRGGKATYHGPGQLVGYPIVPIVPLRIRGFVAALAQCLADYLATLGLRAHYDEQQPGVWIEHAKIAAIGLELRKRTTGYGFALNLSCDLERYRVFRPCGLEAPVTSVKALLGVAPSLDEAARELAPALSATLAPFYRRDPA